MEKKPIIFNLSVNKELTEKVCKILKIKPGKVNIDSFADEEMLVYSETSVRGKEVFVIQSTSNPANDSIMELLIFIDSLKRASAEKITVITPYFGYARQDRKDKGRQPITAKLIANLLTKAGADRLITFDLHASQIQGFFDIPVDNLKAIKILGTEIKKLKIKDLVIAAPDLGGVENARRLADIITPGQAIAGIDKVRIEKNKSELMHVYGNVKNQNVIIIDDIVDTGGTILQAVDAFEKAGAKEVCLVVIHPVFSKDSFEKITNKKIIKKIIISDTIVVRKSHPKVIVVSISKYLATVIKAILDNESLSIVYRQYGKADNE